MAKKKSKDTPILLTEEQARNLPVVPPKKELVLEGDPEIQLAFAKKAADALMKVVSPAKINGKDYLQFGGWQTLGRFFGATVGVEWTKRIERDGKYCGYEARSVVWQNGVIISSAEASCLMAERNWKSRDEYAVKSMAQTRSSAKALRNAFGWVAELAGLESTPAEEMPHEERMEPYQVHRVVEDESDEAGGHVSRPATKEVNPENAQKLQKIEIASLLFKKRKFTTLGKTAEQFREEVMNATGITLEPDNYAAIITELRSL